ncbi:histidine kinase [Cellulomonas rhizosphaerae]|uniref:Histidine kinase n=1 Tax=Cellulomonas rhizosphaerae TaxID=2293719 RepID=A0A413RHW6_9CELL|nr:histidine kinase [Cellulomonas rhizosphaerae]RHA37777.1 histidine kinase [Cellulomonas rhizosphaerae]
MPSEPRDETPDDPTVVVPAADAPAGPEALTPQEDAPDEDVEPPIPSEEELERTATPATVRRAPKYSAFITFGALGGMVVGLLLAVIIHPETRLVADGSGFISFLDGEGAVRTVMVVAVGIVGGFVGGALAVWADKRSKAPRLR